MSETKTETVYSYSSDKAIAGAGIGILKDALAVAEAKGEDIKSVLIFIGHSEGVEVFGSGFANDMLQLLQTGTIETIKRATRAPDSNTPPITRN